ncbi:MAG: hypothetical protein L0216_08905, partial [Planctomycetales bacterium]|nr:hypothetical protein [Planctomycetales bacterium]
ACLTAARDAYLPATLVSAYYAASPPVAEAVRGSAAASGAVRGSLAPWAGLATAPAIPLVVLLALAALLGFTRRRRP